MTTLLNMCPECKGKDIAKKRSGKHTAQAIVLILIGVPLLVFPIVGFLFICIGVAMAIFPEKTLACRSCKAEWK
ncbi:MAG: hypothetical protein HY587_04565 [Candidatus Omnitrophica bacterium]|nr:hypothetical protein [Candidatus Omnitrophota bacterium]